MKIQEQNQNKLIKLALERLFMIYILKKSDKIDKPKK